MEGGGGFRELRVRGSGEDENEFAPRDFFLFRKIESHPALLSPTKM